MSSRRTSSVPKEDAVFPRMLYCDSRCSQTLPGLSPALPGALLCNVTRRLGDGKCVILCRRVRGSVRAVRAVRNTWVFHTETSVVADVLVRTSFKVCINQEEGLISQCTQLPLMIRPQVKLTLLASVIYGIYHRSYTSMAGCFIPWHQTVILRVLPEWISYLTTMT
jgi:hypothetical protein